MEELAGKRLGRYQIVGVIRVGGMATVYEAVDSQIERTVALKVVASNLASDQSSARRFRHEAAILARLQHPNILPLFDFGESDGAVFLVMPLIAGGTLADLIDGRPLQLDVVDRLVRQLCDALGYAHSKGVVHRDIKPTNILLDERRNFLLADFGIAHFAEAAARLTMAGSVVGTPFYMSPEHALGEDVGPASDVYSVGILLYELLTGRVPFKGSTPMAVALQHVSASLPPPRQFNMALSPELEAVIVRALARQPSERFESAEALAGAFTIAVQKTRDAAQRQTVVAPVLKQPRIEVKPAAPPPVVPAPVLPPPGVPAAPRAASGGAGWRPVWKWAALGALVLLAASGAWLARGTPQPAPRQESPPAAAPNAKQEQPVAPVPPPAEPLPPSTEPELWARAVETGRAEHYEDYLKFLLRGGIAGEHRDEARTRLASLWTPQIAQPPTVVRRAPLEWIRGYRGEGCEEESIKDPVVGSNGQMVLYAARTCKEGEYHYTLVAETRNRPPRALATGMRANYDLSEDGRWVILRDDAVDGQKLALLDVETGRPDARVAALPDWWSDATISGNAKVFAIHRGNRVMIYDRTTSRQEAISLTADGQAPDKPGWVSDMSFDGRFLLIGSGASNLLASPVPAPDEALLYVYDRRERTLVLVEQDALGQPPAKSCDALSEYQTIALGDDGQWVVFSCEADGLSLVDASRPKYRQRFYARHVPTGRTWLVDDAALVAYDGNLTFSRAKIVRSNLLIVDRYVGSDANPERTVTWMVLPNGRKAVRSLGLRKSSDGSVEYYWGSRYALNDSGTLNDFSADGCVVFRDTSQLCAERP